MRYSKKSLHLADALTGITFMVSTSLYCLAMWCAVTILKESASFGDAQQLIIHFFFFNVSVAAIVPLTKCCITLLLLEVEPNRNWRRCLYTVQTLLGLALLVGLVVTFFGCYPISKNITWSVLKNGFTFSEGDMLHTVKCMSRRQYIIVNGSLNVFFELWLLVNAFSLVLRSKGTVVQRLGLAFTFSIGMFTILASIMSTIYIYRTYVSELQEYNATKLAEEFFTGSIWTGLEVHTSLTIASILPIRAALIAAMEKISPLYTRIMIRHSSTSSHKQQMQKLDSVHSVNAKEIECQVVVERFPHEVNPV